MQCQSSLLRAPASACPPASTRVHFFASWRLCGLSVGLFLDFKTAHRCQGCLLLTLASFFITRSVTLVPSLAPVGGSGSKGCCCALRMLYWPATRTAQGPAETQHQLAEVDFRAWLGLVCGPMSSSVPKDARNVRLAGDIGST